MKRASGTSYRLFPGPVDACASPARLTAGDLVAELGRGARPEPVTLPHSRPDPGVRERGVGAGPYSL
ncbi:hypothetical protein ACM614_26785 [Streptomyces sp. 12297]|uniref:hypothetical protein n=1 Tax=Streptomyces sp. NBC_00239 TaxID=2903640 RepID=UPI002E2BBB60|nr:hypothetical protein [Streptomyces sp. NBC_00239]